MEEWQSAMKNFETAHGGITAPRGFRACGVQAGIKERGLDLALVVSDRPAVIAGTFTTNRVEAAPVKVSRSRMSGGIARAVVANSGCANACTGAEGLEDARRMALKVSNGLGVAEETVFVCSTGCIGTRLPMDRIEPAIGEAVKALSEEGADSAARAIMTTDTVDKQVAVKFSVEGRPVHIGGMAKGAGMIEPNMATLLGFLATDAAVDCGALRRCLSSAVAASFNRITVDGDQSTNDTVLFMANGVAGNAALDEKHSDWPVFNSAVGYVTEKLAMKIVRDGEGASKLVHVTVRGARTPEDAEKAARAVCRSLLVRTSWHGGDPNWGRVIAAVGCSGAEVREDLVEIRYDDTVAVRNGVAVEEMRLDALKRVLSGDSFSVCVDLHRGDGSFGILTCDCSEEYVRINSEYAT